METYPEMNEKIVEILRQHSDPAALYAAARIEELEGQLAGVDDLLAVMWGADEPHESGDICIFCERFATQEAWPYCRVCLLTAQLEVCSDGFREAHRWAKELERQLETERHTAERACGLLADTVEALQTERGDHATEAEVAVMRKYAKAVLEVTK